MNFKYLFLLFIFPHLLLAQSLPSTTPSQNPQTTQEANQKPSFSNYDDWGYYKKNGRTSKTWNDLVKQGFASYDQKDCEKAIAYFKEAIKAGCSDPIVNFKLAACSEATGSLYSALQYYREAENGLKILKSPHRYQTDFYEAIGRVLLLSKKTNEALPYLTKAVELGESSFGLFFILGEISLQQKETQKALDYFKKANDLSTNSANADQLFKINKTLGFAFLEAKDWKSATPYLNKAAELNPSDSDIQAALYRANEMKRQEELMKFMDKVQGN